MELEKTVRWFNFNDFKKPDTELLKMWADTLVQTYELETLEDFVRFFHLIRKGQININFYERFGYDVIQKAFAKYLDELKLPEREKQIKNEKVEKLKDAERLEKIEGWSTVLKTIGGSQKRPKTPRKGNFKPYTKQDELNDLKNHLESYPKSILKDLQKQYSALGKVSSKDGRSVVIRDPGGKLIESRLSLLAVRSLRK